MQFHHDGVGVTVSTWQPAAFPILGAVELPTVPATTDAGAKMAPAVRSMAMTAILFVFFTYICNLLRVSSWRVGVRWIITMSTE